MISPYITSHERATEMIERSPAISPREAQKDAQVHRIIQPIAESLLKLISELGHEVHELRQEVHGIEQARVAPGDRSIGELLSHTGMQHQLAA